MIVLYVCFLEFRSAFVISNQAKHRICIALHCIALHLERNGAAGRLVVTIIDRFFVCLVEWEDRVGEGGGLYIWSGIGVCAGVSRERERESVCVGV